MKHKSQIKLLFISGSALLGLIIFAGNSDAASVTLIKEYNYHTS